MSVLPVKLFICCFSLLPHTQLWDLGYIQVPLKSNRRRCDSCVYLFLVLIPPTADDSIDKRIERADDNVLRSLIFEHLYVTYGTLDGFENDDDHIELSCMSNYNMPRNERDVFIVTYIQNICLTRIFISRALKWKIHNKNCIYKYIWYSWIRLFLRKTAMRRRDYLCCLYFNPLECGPHLFQ